MSLAGDVSQHLMPASLTLERVKFASRQALDSDSANQPSPTRAGGVSTATSVSPSSSSRRAPRDGQVDPLSSYSNYGKPCRLPSGPGTGIQSTKRGRGYATILKHRWRRPTGGHLAWYNGTQPITASARRASSASPDRRMSSLGLRRLLIRICRSQPEPHHLDLGAVVHHDLEPGALGAGRGFLVDHPQLHPDGLGTDRNRLVEDRPHFRAAPKISTMSIGSPIWPSSRHTYSPWTCSPVMVGLTGITR